MIIQYSIIAIYFVLVFIIGSKVSTKLNDKEFCGYQMGICYVVFASAGEWLGGTATAGVAEYGFLYGLSGAWYTLANALGVLFLSFFFVKLYRKIGRMTIGGIIEFYFGRKVQFVSSILLVFILFAVGVSQVIAAGKLGQSLLGINFAHSTTICILFFLICIIGGGMKAIAHTNIFHMVIMYGGFIVAIAYLIYTFGGIEQFIDNTLVVSQSIGVDLLSMQAIGLPKISSWIIASVLGATTAQAGIQPILASKDDFSAKKACVLIAFIIAPFGILTSVLGIISRVLSEQGLLCGVDGLSIGDSKMALSALTIHLPPILSGFLLSAELAAILSTIAPIILAIGTIVIKDICPNLSSENQTEHMRLVYLRRTFICTGVLICGVTICLENQVHLLDIVYSAYSLRCILFFIILAGIFFKNISSMSISITMLCSFGITLFWTIYKIKFGYYPLAEWYTETYAILTFSVISMLTISFFNTIKKHKSK